MAQSKSKPSNLVAKDRGPLKTSLTPRSNATMQSLGRSLWTLFILGLLICFTLSNVWKSLPERLGGLTYASLTVGSLVVVLCVAQMIYQVLGFIGEDIGSFDPSMHSISYDKKSWPLTLAKIIYNCLKSSAKINAYSNFF